MRWQAFFLAFALSCLTMGGAGAQPAQQAPNSRVALPLPAGYEPSPLFSGFTNEALGVSIVVAEFPGSVYERMAAGFTSEALSKRGIVDVRPGTLIRQGKHIYLRARQTTAAGRYAKLLLLIEEAGVTALVSVNVPEGVLDDGTATLSGLERALEGARVTASRATAKYTYRLEYLGRFREVATLLGTTKLFSIDGKPRDVTAGAEQPVLIVAPSLDQRPVVDLEATAKRAMSQLETVRDLRVIESRVVRIGGLDGVELTAHARDERANVEIVVYQVLLKGKAGGYFRIVGFYPRTSAPQLLGEMQRIAASFRLVH
ncbi:MAG: hypothetical protein AB7U66_10510 [Hyphomicrobiaceae bacterium]